MSSKEALRAFMKKTRKDYCLESSARRRRADRRIVQASLSLIGEFFPPSSPCCVGAYWPLETEVDTRPLITCLVEKMYTVCLPNTEEASSLLAFYQWTKESPLYRNTLGFFYPSKGSCLEPSLLVVPLLAFDLQGHRLGYGKGYYDRTLAVLKEKNPALKTMGLAYSIQQVNSLEKETHDVSLDMIVTEKGVLKPTL